MEVKGQIWRAEEAQPQKKEEKTRGGSREEDAQDA